jgi:endonuclease YncB( thermonuclease family)
MRIAAAGLAAMLCLLAASAAAEVVILPPPARDVTPPGVTPGPKVDGPVERIPAPPTPPPEARWWRFFLPATSDAATFAVDGKQTIRVAGVEPPPVDATCPLADGTKWPCGRTALYSLRRFLHGRAIECYFPRIDGVGDITAPCRVGPTDIGLWLLSQGWARPDDLATDEYRGAAKAAVCDQRGIWRGQEPTNDCSGTAQKSG